MADIVAEVDKATFEMPSPDGHKHLHHFFGLYDEFEKGDLSTKDTECTKYTK